MKLSLQDLKELFACPLKSHSFKVGECYLVRTVTMHHIGRLKAITDTDLVLGDACWLASSGRFYDALKGGELAEVEPFVDDVIIARGALVDATFWSHDLPKGQK